VHGEVLDDGTLFRMDRSEFSKLPYLTLVPEDGRFVRLSGFFDDISNDWVLIVEVRPGELGRIAGGAPVRAHYYGRRPRDAGSDIEVLLSTLVVQHLSWPKLLRQIEKIESDIHLFCDVLEKFELISEHAHRDLFATYLAMSELELLIRVVRSSYDQLQRLVKELVRLLISQDETQKRVRALPDSFAAMTLRGDVPLTANEIVAKYGLPHSMASFYEGEAQFFLHLRAIRNRLEHGGGSMPAAYALPEGIAVNVDEDIWCNLPIWKDVTLEGRRLGPLRVVFAYIVQHMLEVFTSFARAVTSDMILPPPLAGEMLVYLRNPYGSHLATIATTITNPWRINAEPPLKFKFELQH